MYEFLNMYEYQKKEAELYSKYYFIDGVRVTGVRLRRLESHATREGIYITNIFPHSSSLSSLVAHP